MKILRFVSVQLLLMAVQLELAQAASCWDAVLEADAASRSTTYAWIWNATARTYEIREVTLKDLPDPTRLDGTYFRIVRDREDVPLTLEEAGFAGSNVYYHLTLARERMAALGAPMDHLVYPITIRIGVTRTYDQFLKFGKEEEYNNARTINGWFDGGADAWIGGDEIWFHEPRHVKRKLRPWLFCLSERLAFTPVCAKEVRFAPAFAPDVIYHEFGHLVTWPVFGRNQTTFLSEGFSHYLAAAIEDSPVVGDIGWSCVPTAGRYDLRKKTKWHPQTKGFRKSSKGARTVIGALLWRIRARLPEGVGDRLALSALAHLDKRSRETELPQALRSACAELGSDGTSAAACVAVVDEEARRSKLLRPSSNPR